MRRQCLPPVYPSRPAWRLSPSRPSHSPLLPRRLPPKRRHEPCFGPSRRIGGPTSYQLAYISRSTWLIDYVSESLTARGYRSTAGPTRADVIKVSPLAWIEATRLAADFGRLSISEVSLGAILAPISTKLNPARS